MNNKRSLNNTLPKSGLVTSLYLLLSSVPIGAFTSYNQRTRNGPLLSKPHSPVVRNKLNYQHEDSIDGQLHIDSVDNLAFESHQNNNINENNDCDRSSEEQCDLDAYLKFLDRRYHRLHDNRSNALYVLGVAKLASQRLLYQRPQPSNTPDEIDVPAKVNVSTVKIGKGNIDLPYMRKISAGTSVIRRINYRSALHFFTKVCIVLLSIFKNKVIGIFQNVWKNSKLFSLLSLVVLTFVPLV